MSKYKIISATNIVKMIVLFDNTEITVGVDYLNDKVYFEEPLLPDVDYFELEQDILAYLRPNLIPQPVITPEMFQKIKDVKSGNYGMNMPQHGET